MKMSSSHYNIVSLIFILLLHSKILEADRPRCPIGFNLAYTEYKNKAYCYRQKGPEAFTDKFKDCTGNLFTSKLYHSLNFNKPELTLWTDYKALYPGGPFIDGVYFYSADAAGDLIKTPGQLANITLDGFDREDMCVVIDPLRNYTMARCSEFHYRYCFLKPYSDEDNESKEGCEDFEGSWRFWTPRPTCLKPVTVHGGGRVRATWNQSKVLCEKRGGELLNRGWRYSSNPQLSVTGSGIYPLGIVMSPDRILRFDAGDDTSVIPQVEWHFRDVPSPSNDMVYTAVGEYFWWLVNSSFIFYDVICEKPIQLKHLNMTVSVDSDNKLTLKINDTVNDRAISCFTDSETYYPVSVRIKYDNSEELYVIRPKHDGYYWCVLKDSLNYYVTESNKQLFIREKKSLLNIYAVELQLNETGGFNEDDNIKIAGSMLNEYISYFDNYKKIYGEAVDGNGDVERLLKSSISSVRSTKNIQKMNLKKLFFGSGSRALFHVELNPKVDLSEGTLPPAVWDRLEVIVMKPAYYCQGLSSVPATPLGESTSVATNTADCHKYICVGNFNDGVQFVESMRDNCTFSEDIVRSNITLQVENEVTQVMPTLNTLRATAVTRDQMYNPGESSSEENTELKALTTDNDEVFSTEATTILMPGTEDTVFMDKPNLPTTKPRPPTPVTSLPTTPATTPPAPMAPEEQLQQVLGDLQSIVNNMTVTVFVEDIDSAFQQVDDLLALEDELEIPGELLHLLDRLGSRIDLNGTQIGSAVRDNIALVVADADYDHPVKGLRIATRPTDTFTNDAFELITEDMSTMQVESVDNEAVVMLPTSVATSTNRISFVVFRTGRAFDDTLMQKSVNSRVLSINVENLTHFQSGEVVDIYLKPLVGEPERNASRACAFWHFMDDGTGYWSQEGCTFIRSTEPGMLDICRCDHLTHFAEVLVPRTVFSQRNEDALEILTIIGCFLSIIGLLLVALTAILFRSWRRDFNNKIWLQLCISIFIMVLCFLVVIFANFEEYSVACMLFGVALHYSVLASFCWMLVAAVISYRRLVMVFTRDASHKLLRASAFAWGAPCAIVGILLSADPQSYMGRFEEMTPTGSFCYPSGLGLWLAVYAPIVFMLLANWTLFILIVRSVFASRRIQRHGDTNEALRCASVSCLLVFLFGLPWIFGLFASNVVAAYFFTLTATYQGFVLFAFFVLGNKKTRDLWLNKLKIKQTRKVPVTTSTYTNRSTGAAPRAQNPSDSKTSKPKSLSSSDDSRFS